MLIGILASFGKFNQVSIFSARQIVQRQSDMHIQIGYRNHNITAKEKKKIERVAEMLSSALPMMSVELIESNKRYNKIVFLFFAVLSTFLAILLVQKLRQDNVSASNNVQLEKVKGEDVGKTDEDKSFLPKFKIGQIYDVFDHFQKCAPLSVTYFKSHCRYVATRGDYKIIGVLDPDKDGNVPIMVSYNPENSEGLFNIDFIVQGLDRSIITEFDEGVRLIIEGEVDDISKSEGPGLLVNAKIVMYHTDIEKYRAEKRAEKEGRIEKIKAEEKIRNETTVPRFLWGKWSASKICDTYVIYDHKSMTSFINGIDSKPTKDNIYLVEVGDTYFDVYTSFSKFTRYRRVGSEGYQIYMLNTTNGPFYPENQKIMKRCD